MRLAAALTATLLSGAVHAQIAPADILGEARPDVPFSRQGGYSAQILGRHTNARDIPPGGLHGEPLANGETLRFGAVPDPEDPARKVLAFQLAPFDPDTSSSKRAEIAFRPQIEAEKVYWIAFGLYVYDWGRLQKGDECVLGMQVHSGDDRRGLSPTFSIGSVDGRTLAVWIQHSRDPDPRPRNMVSRRYADTPIAFGRWMDFVFRFRQSRSERGFVQGWLDGRPILDYRGPVGYDTPGYKDYVKFGYYNWTGLRSSRKVLLRLPTVVVDPTGSTYAEPDLRRYCCRSPG